MAKTKARELARFGSNVRKLREAKDWTQEQLAERADLDQTYIRGIEQDATSQSTEAVHSDRTEIKRRRLRVE